MNRAGLYRATFHRTNYGYKKRKALGYVCALILALLILDGLSVTPAQAQSPVFVVTCEDSRQVVGYRLTLSNIEPLQNLRLTMIGANNFDPAFAIINADGSVTCGNNTNEAEGSVIAVPSLGIVEANPFSAQRTALVRQDGTLELIVGGFPGESGQFALAIENLRITGPNDTDRLDIRMPPATVNEWMNVFMVSGESRLDAYLEVYEEQVIGQPERFCDNAGTDTCVGVPDLVDLGAIINETETYPGDAFDAGLMLALQSEHIIFEMSDASGTQSGEYIAIVSAIAPGAVIDTSYICTPVEIILEGSSPAYNPEYQIENVIDGNPDTFWVTAVPSAQGASRNAFIVLGFDGEQSINRIRINGFAQIGEAVRDNAIRRFSVQFPNSQGELITAVEGELRAQPGYQSFSFLPATVDEIGLILVENFGGTLFTLVDIQVCAAE
jgi:hypothetical protein